MSMLRPRIASLPRELLFRLPFFQPPSVSLSTVAFRVAANVVDELEQRGLVADVTSRGVRSHVAKTAATVYLGVDPSARSLHVGNLLALIGLLHFRLHGHNVVALIGGATGAVGDPSGRSTERNALPQDVLQANSLAITSQVSVFYERGAHFAATRRLARYANPSDEPGPRLGTCTIENNLSWFADMGLLDFLGAVGKNARISTMLSRESVKSRLESTSGLSFTEFTYQLLQSYDFLTLHRRHNCTIQLGGSDQLGNIMSGVDLIRKTKDPLSSDGEGDTGLNDQIEQPAYGVTMPLLTTANGEKFGKSAGNAIWLDPTMTSPFDLYQFFLRTTDEEVHKYLKIFTFIRVAELEGIMADHKVNPGERVAQKILASEVTELVHGSSGLRQALAATNVAFGKLDSIDVDETIDALDARPLSLPDDHPIPSVLVKLEKSQVVGLNLEHVLIASGLLPSKTQARKALDVGSVQVNGVKVPAKSFQRSIEEKDLLGGRLLVLRSGKLHFKAILLQ